MRDKIIIEQNTRTVNSGNQKVITVIIQTDTRTEIFQIPIPEKPKEIVIQVGDEIFKLLKTKNL
jgi:hypothetical protein